MCAMYLVNDDEPSQFQARRVGILRDDVSLEGKPGLLVSIEPPIGATAGGPLARALLVPRHGDVDVDALRHGEVARPASVFVCRLESEVTEPVQALTRDDVSIVFWGRVNSSAARSRVDDPESQELG